MRRAIGATLLLLSGCACPTASIIATPTPSATATPTTAPSIPTPSPSSAMPAELAGRWRLNLGSAGSPDIVILTLQDRSYRVVRGGFSGTGSIELDGDTITFAHANQCDGDTGGRYHWQVADGMLTFTARDTDPCPRAGILDGKTYTRLDAG